MKKAFITGVAGQDGSYLAELLLAKGYEVFGFEKQESSMRYVPSSVQVLYGDLMDGGSLRAAVASIAPDEVYNLGGVTDLKTAYASPEMTWSINYECVGALLDACVRANTRVRFLQASSSEIFLPSSSPLHEESPRDWETENPYAIAKMSADRDCIAQSRETQGACACSAILFNHESPRRSEAAVVKKITRTLVKIKLGMESKLLIGNVDLSRDWGFAGDYVEVMWKMLQLDAPEDFVIATGKLHTVRDAIDIAAQILDLDLKWHGEGAQTYATDDAGTTIIKVVPEFYKPTEQYPKAGDARHAEKRLGWKQKVDFPSLIEMMVKADIDELVSYSSERQNQTS